MITAAAHAFAVGSLRQDQVEELAVWIAIPLWTASIVLGLAAVAIRGTLRRHRDRAPRSTVAQDRPPPVVPAPPLPAAHAVDPVAVEPAPTSPIPDSGPRNLDENGTARIASLLALRGRHEGAENALFELLADALDPREWHRVRGLPLDTVRAPVALLGATGAFVLDVAVGTWSPEAIEALQTAARELEARLKRLAGYPHPVHAALVFSTEDMGARQWTTSTGATGWIVGRDHFVDWIGHFDDPGFTAADLARLRQVVASEHERRNATPARRIPGELGRG